MNIVFEILRAMNEACPVECFCSIQDTSKPDELVLMWQFKLHKKQHQFSHLINEFDGMHSRLSITDKIAMFSDTDIKPYIDKYRTGEYK